MKYFFIAFSFIFSQVSFAQNPAAIVDDFKVLLKQYKLGPVADQAFCYEDSGIQGYRTDKLQRIASLTKLFTTLLASETLDLQKRYTTKFYISGDRLHIEGGRDPYFEEEKFFLFMDALRKFGHTSFKSVTFDSKFLFTDAAQGSHQELTPAHTRSRLAFYMNKANAKLLRATWLGVVKFAREEAVDLDPAIVPQVTAVSVTQSEMNPLKSQAPIVFIHESKPLHQILKSMNVMSKNILSHNIFVEAGRNQRMDLVFQRLGIPKNSYAIYNGSGLPVINGNKRVDNLSTCASVLQVIKALPQSLKRHNLNVSDVIAVNGGQDLGSFRNRFIGMTETHEAVLAKTGTIKNASSLAGFLVVDYFRPFAILNHTAATATARSFQDAFVGRLFDFIGSPTPIPYDKISIFPWDESPFLKDEARP